LIGAALVADGLEWHSVGVVSAAVSRFWASHTNTGVVVVQGVALVFPVSPQVVVPVGIVPLSSQSGGKSGIAFAKVFFVLVVVGSTAQITVDISRPPVFTNIGVPFGGNSGDSVVSGDTFVAP